MQKQLLYLIALLSLTNAACRKFVELEPSEALVTTGSVFEDGITATTALTGIYCQMHDRDLISYRLSAYTALCVDELRSAYSFNDQLYQNALLANNAPTNDIWTSAYSCIYQANVVYEGCEKSTAINAAVKKQLMAEARFIRAFWYFYLVNLYGEVPLALTTEYHTNAVLVKSSTEIVYRQVVSDLQFAQSNLNVNYVGSNSETSNIERVRPSQAVATAMLARVYLYLDNYANAEGEATKVINDANYLLDTVPNVFSRNTTEAIWQLMKPTPINGTNTYEGQNFIITTAVPITNTDRGSYTLQPELLNAFETGDLRKDNWVGKASGGEYYYPFKFKISVDNNVTEASEYTQPLRLAETILIRAEARAMLNKLPAAIGDLDLIRYRAKIPLIKNINPGMSKEDLIISILKERRVELFSEWGHRWLDLKRTNQINPIMNSVSTVKGSIWKPEWALWPIPASDVSRSINLKQNEGYN
jgi:starch-binding outer membrane protein, SusD/RagB family